MAILHLCVFVYLLAVGTHGAAFDFIERNLDRAPCGRSVLTGNVGFLTSHSNFGRRIYPRRLNCVWRIVSPPHQRILAVPTFMSVESERECRHDRVDFFNGLSGNASGTHLGTLCGGNLDAMFLSSGNGLTIKFKTDSTIGKMGFSLRYMMVDKDFIPIGAHELRRRDRVCTENEFRCGSGLCLPRKFLCDRFDDCGDQSDEQSCINGDDHGQCGPAKFPCGDKCIYYYQKCNGVFDCDNRDDERFCGEDGIMTPTNATPPFDPTVWTRVTCGVSVINPRDSDPRIVGGQVAKPWSWPWTVSLRYYGSHTCGGSIIGSRWILTAAHCVEGQDDPRYWQIAAGLHQEYDTGLRVQERNVSRIIFNPQWNMDEIDYDLALLELSSPLEWTTYVRPICLPPGESLLAIGSNCIIAGWGETKGTGGAGYLKQGSVKTFANSQCDEWYGGGITDRMTCAGLREGGVDSCQGDSGGPLMCEQNQQWFIRGATSFGGECGAAESPGVYSRVSSMRDWITQTTDV